MEWEMRLEAEVLGGNLPQHHSVHHMNWRWIKPRAAAVGSRQLAAWTARNDSAEL
jgi:hypothetical protein